VSAELTAATAEIEAHVAAAGWDRPPSLFALVRDGDVLMSYEQEALPDGPLDEVLAQIGWPDDVTGCALSQEIVVLPPSTEATLSQSEIASRAADHPERREARLVVAVLRGSEAAAVMRLRGENEDDVLTGPELAPNLARALRATLE
jgi:hypothetical protein